MSETYKITFKDGATQVVEAESDHLTETWMTFYTKVQGRTRMVLRVAAGDVLSVAVADVADRVKPSAPRSLSA